MHPLQYPIPKLTIGFMGGVFLSNFVVLKLSTIGLGIALVVSMVSFFHFKRAPQNKSITSILLLLLFLLLGLWTTLLHEPKSQNHHYSHFLEQINTSNRLVLKVRSEMNPTAYNYRYKAKVVEMNNQKSSGEILISIPKNTAIEPLLVDDLLYIQTELKTINPPKNPYAFSYKEYMERKGIFHQIYLQEHSKCIRAKGKQSINGWASKAKTFVESKIDALNINTTARAFLKAFYLGIRNGTTFETHSTKTDSINTAFIEDYSINQGVYKNATSRLKRFYTIDGNQLLLVDSLGLFDFKSTTFDWVLLRNSPKIHLEQLINSIQPKLIIADGSNYKSFVERWKKTCTQKGVKFYNTNTNGAFIYPIN